MNEISNILVSIRNSIISKRLSCTFKPKSLKVCFRLLKLLYLEGYILSYWYDTVSKKIIINNNYLKKKPAISILKIYNKSSFPIYVRYTDLISMHKYGVDLLIISTTKGFLPHYKAIQYKLGGQLICYIR